jgi:hypothetical protein
MAASASTEEVKQGRPGIDFGKGVAQIPAPDGGLVPGSEVYRQLIEVIFGGRMDYLSEVTYIEEMGR